MAERATEAGLTISQALGHQGLTGVALRNLGRIALKLGEYGKALSYYCQNLQVVQEAGHQRATFLAVEDIAYLLIKVGQHHEVAVRFLGAAATLRRETGIPVPDQQQAAYEQSCATLRQRLGEEIFTAQWQAGQTTPLAQIVAEAMTLSL